MIKYYFIDSILLSVIVDLAAVVDFALAAMMLLVSGLFESLKEFVVSLNNKNLLISDFV